MQVFNFVEPENYSDFHSVTTITLGELYEGGFFKPSETSWKWKYYSLEQYKRVCEKFLNRYFMRDIAITPPGNWKREYMRLMNEIMPKYIPSYKAIDEGADILAFEDEFSKSRDIYSEFPQTLLNGNQDYASTGTDRESERIKRESWFDTISKLKDYNDIDVMILNECEKLFSCLYSVSINGY